MQPVMSDFRKYGFSMPYSEAMGDGRLGRGLPKGACSGPDRITN